MEMSEMLDVLHYYMEEDYNLSSGDQIDARSKLRKTIYKLMYNKEYVFGTSSSANTSPVMANGLADTDPYDDVVPVDPIKGPTKSFVPPTDFNPDLVKPFGDVLDAPLGL
jgi:hypothetical protein